MLLNITFYKQASIFKGLSDLLKIAKFIFKILFIIKNKNVICVLVIIRNSYSKI